jgi:hypothetical protein
MKETSKEKVPVSPTVIKVPGGETGLRVFTLKIKISLCKLFTFWNRKNV